MGLEFTGVVLGAPGLHVEPNPLAELLDEAKAWYDTTPATLQTDLAASFDGVNQSLSVADASYSGDFSTGDFTISLWVKPNGSGDIFTQYGTAGNQRSIRLAYSSPNYLIYGSPDGSAAVSTTATGTSGVYSLVVIRYTGGSLKVSVNAGTESSVALASVFDSTSDIVVGARPGAGYIDAEVSKVAVWSRALSTVEVSEDLYTDGSRKPYSELSTAVKTSMVSFWEQWESRGVYYDSHGTNHLTNNNSVVGAQTGVFETAGEYAGITKWINRGGNASPFGGLTPSSPSTAPQLVSGVPVFDGTALGLQTTIGTATRDNTIVVIGSGDSVPAGAVLFDGGAFSGRQSLFKAGGLVVQSAGGAANSSAFDGESAFILFARFPNGSDMSLTINGVDYTTGGALAINDLDGVTIGARTAQSGQWGGTIEEVLVFDRLLTTAEIAALTTHFA